MQDLGIPVTSNDRMHLIGFLNAYLLDQNNAERNVVVIIDEAQDLPPSVMEQIRLLSNLETDQNKLMQIVLVGQPELDVRLGEKELRQLRQRIMVNSNLTPLTKRETGYYIDHRLYVAGAADEVNFEHKASSLVYKASQGLPRLVNKICDSAMLSGYVAGTKVITHREVKRALGELEGLI